MGRHPKYTSPAERKAANRAKSKRSYWRNQTEINARRRERYREEIESTTTVIGTTKTVREWTAGTTVHDIKAQFEHYISPSSLEFIDSKITHALQTESEKPLSCSLEYLENLLKEAQTAENEIYAWDGVSKLWRVAHTLSSSIRTVIKALEEVSCAFLEGIDTARDAYCSRTFQFQK